MAVDGPDDAPKAYAHIGGGGRSSRDRHGRAGGRIVAPVEEVLRRDSDGWVQGCRPWVCQSQGGRDAQIPQDTDNSGWKTAQDGRMQRRCSTADSFCADYTTREAPEKQSKRPKAPRSPTSWVHFQECGCTKLGDSAKELIIALQDDP